MEMQYGDDLSLESLAKSASVSKSECLRCFKQTLQTTPYKYLMEYRLQESVILLQETNLAIGYIADKVGFHQVSHFGKCFKEKMGCSPKEYRKKVNLISKNKQPSKPRCYVFNDCLFKERPLCTRNHKRVFC